MTLPGVIAAHADGEPVRFLVYSHGHADHVGGSRAFADVAGLRIVAPAAVAAAIKSDAPPGILAPNVTFGGEHMFSLGRERVEIRTANFHSENTDAIVYVPRQKLIVAVDTITPGDVPYANFGSTSRFAGYVVFFDEIMRYDFDTILTGHTAVLGTREDVVINREYVHDVRDTALRGMKTEGRKEMAVKRMDNVLIVVDDLEATKAFFIELGLKLEGETTVEGPSVGFGPVDAPMNTLGIRRIMFAVEDIDAVVARMRAHGSGWTARR